jgi:hypothetical protein
VTRRYREIPFTVFARARIAPVAGALLMLALCVDAAGATLAFDLDVVKGKVPPDMRVLRAKQGDDIKLRFNVDQPMTLHLHGYNIEKRIVPGTVGEMQFNARATGRFPIEAHKSGGKSDEGEEAPVAYLEVYPQ